VRNKNRFGLYRHGLKNILRNLFFFLVGGGGGCLFGFLIIFLLCFRSNVGWGWEKIPRRYRRRYRRYRRYSLFSVTIPQDHSVWFWPLSLPVLWHFASYYLALPLSFLFCLFVCLFEQVPVRNLKSKNGLSVTRSPVRIKYFKKSWSKGVHLCGLM